MLLSIQELEVRKIRFDSVYQPGKLDFSSTGIRQISPLHAAGEAEILENTGGEIRVQGRLTVSVEADCDRCLAAAKFDLDAPFDLFYQPSSIIDSDEDEIEIDEGSAEIAFYEGAGIELEEVLQEQVVLLLPAQRLCNEGCQGICPICGKNRNESGCHCTATLSDDRWSGLKQFKKEAT
jgi:uncharacterized protein